MQPDTGLVCQCGNPKRPRGRYCRPCWTRWMRAGYPETGPPPPVPVAESARRATAARQANRRARDPDDPDGYETRWATALEPQRRIKRATPAACDLARCVAVRDAQGVARLLARYRDRHPALLIVLASTANPVLARMVARQAPEPAVRAAAVAAVHLTAAVQARSQEQVDTVLGQVTTWDGYAALAVVLAECQTQASARETSAA
jgi:hypothetical protein